MLVGIEVCVPDGELPDYLYEVKIKITPCMETTSVRL